MISHRIKIGTKFGNLLVVEELARKKGKKGWKAWYYSCVCDCGSIVVVSSSGLRKENNCSCGCLRHRGIKDANKKKAMAFVKPFYKISDVINVAKFMAAKEYCNKLDWVFEIWTEDEIFENRSSTRRAA